MWAVRVLHEIGAGRHSICHKRLFVGIVLRLIANQNGPLSRLAVSTMRGQKKLRTTTADGRITLRRMLLMSVPMNLRLGAPE